MSKSGPYFPGNDYQIPSGSQGIGYGGNSSSVSNQGGYYTGILIFDDSKSSLRRYYFQ